jgi:hypothetical protein
MLNLSFQPDKFKINEKSHHYILFISKDERDRDFATFGYKRWKQGRTGHCGNAAIAARLL